MYVTSATLQGQGIDERDTSMTCGKGKSGKLLRNFLMIKVMCDSFKKLYQALEYVGICLL